MPQVAPLFRAAARFVGPWALAALLVSVPAAHARSPELQDLLKQVSEHWRFEQGDRLDEKNCDYTAVDYTKQALVRAGLTNAIAGPVVISALENACKGALDAFGFGLATTTYSFAKCVLDHYTTANDARSLVLCLGVEAGGFAAGKLVDFLDIDPSNGAITGRVIDGLGDRLKADGLDEATAAARQREIREFARELKEALDPAQQAAREASRTEEPPAIIYPNLSQGCTVEITMRFQKAQPPTRGANTLSLLVNIKDCDCDQRPRIGKALRNAQILIRVPVTFTPGAGGKPAWTADLPNLTSRIRSVCCDGSRGGGGIDPGRGGIGTTGETGSEPPAAEPPPPAPPAPPARAPTFAERCPECIPIIREIEQDRADIEGAQGRIDRADAELREIRREGYGPRDEIDRARQLIQRLGRNMGYSGSAGGVTRTVEITPDGRKRTTVTQRNGRTETSEEPTGNPEIDAAHDRIVAAQQKLRELAVREEAARARRQAAEAEKAAAEAKLRADEARLRDCEEQCRRRIAGLPPAPPALQVPGGTGAPVPPPQGAPPGSGTPQTGPREPPGIPPLPPAACKACEPEHDLAGRLRKAVLEQGRYVEDYQRGMDQIDALLAGRTPPPNVPGRPRLDFEAWKQKSAQEKAEYRRGVAETLDMLRARLLVYMEEYLESLEKLEACNRACAAGDVSVGSVTGVTGTNPFDPDNPAGTGTQAPPPPPPPAGGPGTLQFSSPTYATAEGQGVVGITVTRAGGATGAASVSFFTGEASASAGADYQAVSGTLTWAAGESGAKSFTVPIVDDSVPEATETFSVRLEAALGATPGAITSATVSIADNDAPQRGSLQFSSASYNTAEGQGSVAITVTRTGGSSGAVSVQYNTGQNSAISGADYQTALGTLSWADGDIGPKSFSVTIIDDSFAEPTEAFTVTLGNPTGGATLGSPATANVSIADNDAAGPCGAAGNAWLPNRGTYSCAGSCVPTPSTQALNVEGDRVTISPFHAGGAATFTGCTNALNSDSNSLVFFGQANHRATITRGATSYNANIRSSGGGQCSMSCSRVGP